MAPLGFAAYMSEASLKKGSNYIFERLKSNWVLTSLTLKVWGQIYDYFPKPPNFSDSYCTIKIHLGIQLSDFRPLPSAFSHLPSAIYSYWFFLLYCSVISISLLNFSTLSGFIFPAFITFLLAFSQFKWSCSSILCRDGFRWFVLMKSTTSL